ncbi:hypothetical protein ES703_118483 [subsurface metagenome]
MRWQLHFDGKRGHWCIFPSGFTLLELSIVTEVIPEIECRTAPALSNPGRAVANPVRSRRLTSNGANAGLGRGSQRYRAPLFRSRGHTLGIHKDTLHISAFAEVVSVGLAADRYQVTFPILRLARTVYADEVGHTATDRSGYRLAGLIVKHVPQDSYGYAAGFGVAGYKRVERLDAHVNRHVRIREHHLSKRVGSSERTLAEPR